MYTDNGSSSKFDQSPSDDHILQSSSLALSEIALSSQTHSHTLPTFHYISFIYIQTCTLVFRPKTNRSKVITSDKVEKIITPKITSGEYSKFVVDPKFMENFD